MCIVATRATVAFSVSPFTICSSLAHRLQLPAIHGCSSLFRLPGEEDVASPAIDSAPSGHPLRLYLSSLQLYPPLSMILPPRGCSTMVASNTTTRKLQPRRLALQHRHQKLTTRAHGLVADLAQIRSGGLDCSPRHWDRD